MVGSRGFVSVISSLSAVIADRGRQAVSEAKSSGKNPPIAWQDKRVLRKIRDSFDSANTIASALGTYTALTVVASDKQVEEFQTTHSWLAGLSGFSERTVRDRMADLARLGFVAVSTPALRAPSTYRLLPFGEGCLTSGNGCRAFGKREAPPLPPSELVELTEGERGERQSLPVELPRGFPKNEADAAKQAAFCGCTEDFARIEWNQAAARGGTDYGGNPIASFRHYLSARAAKERGRQGERQPATGKASAVPSRQIRKDLEEEERELAGRLHDFYDRERDPAGVARLATVRAELANMKGRSNAIA
ncbi:MAG: hypothetical protein B9S33_18575 [Pedosphaera sp. Tous-C6FEB]|nr:MAG: hypothetical protein B9S33_18575 [Pedosphaera sp. Tous-C6FEB]